LPRLIKEMANLPDRATSRFLKVGTRSPLAFISSANAIAIAIS
jgi:hypothetical protein